VTTPSGWPSSPPGTGGKGSVYVVSAVEALVLEIDLEGVILDSFLPGLPNLEEDPLAPATFGSVSGMAWDPGGDGGRGSLWIVEHYRGLLYELDLTAKVIREVLHPLRAIEAPNSGLPDLMGISAAPGTGFLQVYLSGEFEYLHGASIPVRWER
jgi:hypothetical protein